MKRLIIELDDDLHAQIKTRAAKQRKTIKLIVTELLYNWTKEKAAPIAEK